MPDLRAALDGFGEVQTYVQSGNVVLSSRRSAERVRTEVERVVEQRFGFQVHVVVRTGDELADVIRRNPLGDVAANPKWYLVTFLASELPDERLPELAALSRGEERLAAAGRELYSWHPEGAARSKLWAKLASAGLGVTATSRNWTTVGVLAEMADAR